MLPLGKDHTEVLMMKRLTALLLILALLLCGCGELGDLAVMQVEWYYKDLDLIKYS